MIRLLQAILKELQKLNALLELGSADMPNYIPASSSSDDTAA